MKRLLAVLIAAVLVFSLAACGNANPENNVSGGWEIYTDTAAMSMSDDAMQAYMKATAEVSDVSYTPIALLGSQVVAGMNYAFLVIEKDGNKQSMKVLIIYSDLDGVAKITKVSDFIVSDYTQGNDATPDQGLAGGWYVDPETSEQALPEEAQKAFDKAAETFTGSALKPLALLATQLVAGKNYAILCMSEIAAEQPVCTMQVVTVYADLEGNAQITSIHTLNAADFN